MTNEDEASAPITNEDEIEASILWWNAREGSEWHLTFYFKPIAGRVECVGFEIRPSPYPGRQGQRLTATTLRDLDFATQLAQAQRRNLEMIEGLIDIGQRISGGRAAPDASLLREAAILAQGAGQERGRRRHAPYTEDQLGVVVAEYLRAYARGSRSPTRDMAEALGIPYARASKLVRRCRAKGLLPKTTQGVARGATAPKEGE
jgi:hypothetical protein